jgi:hypothetical protein
MEQQQVGEQVRTIPYSSPMHNFAGSILLLTNPDNELYKLELSLRNMVVDREGNAKSAGRQLMNDDGIMSVLGQVQAIVNQVTVMSNLEPQEIPRLVDFLADTLARDLMVNRQSYAIENAAARDKIYFIALTSAFICMKRANEEGERRFWKGSQQEITTRVDGLAGQKKGVLGKLLGWAGK